MTMVLAHKKKHKQLSLQTQSLFKKTVFSSVDSFVREPVRMNESLGRTNRTGLFLSFVSFTIRFTGNSTERTNKFPVALTPLSLTDTAENRAMAGIP